MFFHKIVVIKIPVPLIHGNTRNVQQAVRPLGHQVHFIDRFRRDPGFKGAQRLRIGTFGHPVMVGGDKGLKVFTIGHQIPAGPFHPAHAVQPDGPADGNHVGGPGRGKIQPGTDLHHPLTIQNRLIHHCLFQKSVGKHQPQPVQFLIIQGA